MRLYGSFHLTFAIAVLFTLFAGACSPLAAPMPTTTTRNAGPATIALEAGAAGTPTLVAFPTFAAPATLPPATLTLSAPPARGSVVVPVLQVVAPLTNTQVSVDQTVYVVAFAAGDNAIARIEVSDDNVPVHTETPATPLQTLSVVIPWTPGQIGAHVLRVVAFDTNNVASGAEDISVNVTPDTRKPTSTIIYPLGTPQVELGSILQVYAAGTDEVGVTQLDLLVDNQLYTYMTAPNPWPASFPTVFAWTATQSGNHTLVVRTHDSQDQTTDSAALKVFVVDTHSPAVSLAADRTVLQAGESMTVTISALDVSGIQRVELWTGKEVSTTSASAIPARQTSMIAQIPWQNGNAGEYQLTARAYNADGNYKESAPVGVSVVKPGQPTPTRAPLPTPTRTRVPRPVPTATLQPPAPPAAEITQPQDGFAAQGPFKVTFSGRGSGELDRVELWGYYHSQPVPQVICTLDAKASTQKTGQCDWPTANAGPVSLYAQAIDIFHQVGRSAVISGTISVPSLPTATPTPVSMSGRWTASIATGQYVVNFRPIVTSSGTALRGDFKIATAATPAAETNGRIVSGTVKGDRVTFRVDFSVQGTAPATSAPDAGTPSVAPTASPAAAALDFDCGVTGGGMSLDCKFKDARNQSGAATFAREP